jgi:hypothetical protein
MIARLVWGSFRESITTVNLPQPASHQRDQRIGLAAFPRRTPGICPVEG